MFYLFRQINSGGFFEGAPFLIVEAASSQEAEALAVDAGAYFDGVAAGRDCECCGDRWTRYADEFTTLEEAIASIDDRQQPDDGGPAYRVARRPVD